MRLRTRTTPSHLKRCTAGRCYGALPVRDAQYDDLAEPKLKPVCIRLCHVTLPHGSPPPHVARLLGLFGEHVPGQGGAGIGEQNQLLCLQL